MAKEKLTEEEVQRQTERNKVLSEFEDHQNILQKMVDCKKTVQTLKRSLKKDKSSKDQTRETLNELSVSIQSLYTTPLNEPRNSISPRRSPRASLPTVPILASNSEVIQSDAPKKARFDVKEEEDRPSDKASFRTRSLLFKSATVRVKNFDPISQNIPALDQDPESYGNLWMQPGSLIEVRTLNIWNDAVILSSSRSGRYHVIMIGSGLEDDVKAQNIREKPELKRVESAKLRRNISQTLNQTISQWRTTTTKDLSPSG